MQQHSIDAQVQAGVLSAWQTVHVVLDLRTGTLSAGPRVVRVRGADVTHSRRGTTLVSSTKSRRVRLLTMLPAPAVTRAAWRAFTAALSLGALSPPGFRVLRALGSGGSGRVYLAAPDDDPRATVALKLVPRTHSADVASERRMAVAAPAHPRIVRTLRTFFAREHLVVVMQYAPGGSLLDVAEAGDLPLAAVRRTARQLLEAVAALHAAGIAHRDVKLENAVMDSDGALRLCDLGLAAAEPVRGFSRAVGTSYTQAPEMTRCGRYGRAADLWSVGVVVLVLLLRAVPFTKRNRDALFASMAARARAGNDPLGALIGAKRRAELPDEMLSLLRGLLQLDPAKRLDAEAALRHPWFDEEEEESTAPNFLAIAQAYMQIRRRVASIRTRSAVADAKKRLLAAVRMVGFITTLYAQAGLGESSLLVRSGAQAPRRLLAAQPLLVNS